MICRIIILFLMLVSLLGVTACDSEPPVLMKASKQFETNKIRDQHISYMRKNHMDALIHKRDETMYKGIRTERNSINACINCHVPESYQGKILRHTDQEHFCTSCHTYVAVKLDCFECHVDHPIKSITDSQSDVPSELSAKALEKSKRNYSYQLNKLQSLEHQELVDLAFKYSSDETIQEQYKSGGVSFNHYKKDKLNNNNNDTYKASVNTSVNTTENPINHSKSIMIDESDNE